MIAGNRILKDKPIEPRIMIVYERSFNEPENIRPMFSESKTQNQSASVDKCRWRYFRTTDDHTLPSSNLQKFDKNVH